MGAAGAPRPGGGTPTAAPSEGGGRFGSEERGELGGSPGVKDARRELLGILAWVGIFRSILLLAKGFRASERETSRERARPPPPPPETLCRNILGKRNGERC